MKDSKLFKKLILFFTDLEFISPDCLDDSRFSFIPGAEDKNLRFVPGECIKIACTETMKLVDLRNNR